MAFKVPDMIPAILFCLVSHDMSNHSHIQHCHRVSNSTMPAVLWYTADLWTWVKINLCSIFFCQTLSHRSKKKTKGLARCFSELSGYICVNLGQAESLLRSGNLNWENAWMRLGWRQTCKVFSYLVIDVVAQPIVGGATPELMDLGSIIKQAELGWWRGSMVKRTSTGPRFRSQQPYSGS